MLAVVRVSRSGWWREFGAQACQLRGAAIIAMAPASQDGWQILAPVPGDEPLIPSSRRHQPGSAFAVLLPIKILTSSLPVTQLYARAMAFVAFDEATNEMVGVVRIHSDSIYETGEYAILLRSDLKARGLGWALMQLIIEYARSEGLKTISGDVLQENLTMLTMCRDLGFEVKADPLDHGICHVTLKL